MSTHKCPYCEYTSSRKYNLERHIKNVHKDPPKVALVPPKVAACKTCDMCGKTFTRVDNFKRHINEDRCSRTNNPLECPLCNVVLSSKYAKSRHMKGCVGLPDNVPNSQTIPLASTTNNVITTNNDNSQRNYTTNTIATNSFNTVHVHINNFGEENLSYLSNEFLEKCFETEVTGVKTLMDNIYFNIDHPENHNVRLTSLKHAIAEVYKDNQWIPKGLHDTIERMILKSVTLITSTIATTKEPTDQSLQSMCRLQGMKDNNKKLGCGYKYCNGTSFVVCRYYKPGNVRGQYAKNVMPIM